MNPSVIAFSVALFSIVFAANACASPATIAERARTFAEAGVDVRGEAIRCDLHGFSRTPPDTDRAGWLAAVASADRVVFFTHGFDMFAPDGRRTHQQVSRDFATYARLVPIAADTAATCTVRWPSVKGFGEDQPALAHALTAVHALAAARPARDAPVISVVGFSAGGNFVKDAVVRALADNAGEWSRRPKLRVVTIATPHKGVPLAWIAADTAASLLTSLTQALGKDAAASLAASDQLSRFRAERGVRQLSGAGPEDELAQLQARFERVSRRVEYFNIYSASDETVPLTSTAISDDVDFAVPAGFHFGLLAAEKPKALDDLFYRIIAGDEVDARRWRETISLARP